MQHTYYIQPLHWGNSDIWISDWLAQFTLCLSPLIAHILSGAPTPSYLCFDRPRWHERLCLFNPISIVWRYAAIAERRIQSKSWQPIDIAATNAIFWSSTGWDGSEAMKWRAMPYITSLPDRGRVKILSLEMLKTVILFFQGVQAVTAIVAGYTSTGTYTSFDTISGLFIPLGIIGLLRLFAAPWLIDDYSFGIPFYDSKRLLQSSNKRHGVQLSIDNISFTHTEEERSQPSVTPERYAWSCSLFRVFFLLPIMGSWALAIIYMTPWVGVFGVKEIYTTSSFLLGLYYLFLTTPMLLILGYHFLKGPLKTTIIPCISTLWYKAYCIALALFTVVLIAISAAETRKTICGKYTSHTADFPHPCAVGETKLIEIGPTSNQGFTIAQLVADQIVITNITGVCLGLPTIQS